VCLEDGKEIPMKKGRGAAFYFYHECPECGNLALIDKGTVNRDCGFFQCCVFGGGLRCEECEI
jgi:hypothetical protein